MVETAIVLPVLFVFLLGTITIAMGIFRYQQVAALAREGARYASVRGGQYAQESGNGAADYKDIYNNAILPLAVGLDPNRIIFNSSSVSWPNGNWPTTASSSAATSSNPAGTPVINAVSITVGYQWIPESFISGTITLSSTSVMPISY
jgi:Flp pilus assembly protein TadG